MQSKSRKLRLTILIVCHLCLVTLAVAGKWERLGERQVTNKLDHDTIVVTSARGDFVAIKLTVHKRAVTFHRVVVHFRNGGDQEVEIHKNIPADGETRGIDLRGGDRVIHSVDFWYDAKSLGGKQAIVRLWARN